MKTKINLAEAMEAIFRALDNSNVRNHVPFDIDGVTVKDTNLIQISAKPFGDHRETRDEEKWNVVVLHHTNHSVNVHFVRPNQTRQEYEDSLSKHFIYWNGPFAVKKVGESFQFFQYDGKGWMQHLFTVHKHHAQPLRDLIIKCCEQVSREDDAARGNYCDTE